MARGVPVVCFVALAWGAACNSVLGNDRVSVWNPEAGAADALAAGDARPPIGVAEQIVSIYAGTCIDVGSPGKHATLTLCADLPEQLIVLRSMGLEDVTLFHPQSGLCIGGDAADGGIESGTALTLQTCNEGPGQVFHLVGSAQSFALVAAGNFCVDDKAFGGGQGTEADLWGCNGGANQMWAVMP